MSTDRDRDSGQGDSADERNLPTPPPPQRPFPDTNPAHGIDDKGAYAGKPDQEVKHTTGAGAGGATDWGPGNANHPSRVKSHPPGAA